MSFRKTGWALANAALFTLFVPAFAQADRKIHDQETTLVQASPLELKKAEKLKQKRGMPGVGNRAELMRELEGAKLRDHQARTEALHDYNSGLGKKKNGLGKSFQQSGSNSAASTLKASAPAPTGPSTSSLEAYLNVQGGYVDHYQVANTEGQGAVGLGVGAIYNNQWSAEANFLFSNHQSSHGYCQVANANCGSGDNVDVLRTNSIDTYAIGLLGRYDLNIWSKIRPGIGLIATYTYRQHFANQSDDVRSSQAGDIGPMIGVDFVATNSIRIGLNWRYMMNMTFDAEAGTRNPELREVTSSANSEWTSIEDSDYQVWLLTAKYIF